MSSLLIILLTLLSLASAKDTYSEVLTLYQLPNHYSLANFSFQFVMDTNNDDVRIDKMPLSIYKLVKEN